MEARGVLEQVGSREGRILAARMRRCSHEEEHGGAAAGQAARRKEVVCALRRLSLLASESRAGLVAVIQVVSLRHPCMRWCGRWGRGAFGPCGCRGLLSSLLLLPVLVRGCSVKSSSIVDSNYSEKSE